LRGVDRAVAEERAQAWRRVRVAVLASGLAVSVVVGVGTLIAWRISRQAPDWWRQVDASDPETVTRAESLENGIASAMHRVDRPLEISPGGSDAVASGDSGGAAWRSEPWSFSVSAADANAWLNTRLWKWLANRDERLIRPDALREVQIEFEDGLIRLGVRLDGGGGWLGDGRVLSASVRAGVERGTALRVPAVSVAIGRLPLPPGLILDEAERSLSALVPEGADTRDVMVWVFDSLSGSESERRIEPVVDVGGGRRVRIVSVRARNGWLELTCRTEHSPSP